MARKLWRTAASLGFIVSVAACSGGGCGSCGAPISGGFPSEQTIPNAATVRITRSGLDFASTTLPNVVGTQLGAKNGEFDVDVPQTDPGDQQIFDAGICQLNLDPNICPNGPNPTSMPPQCRVKVGVPALGQHKMNLHLDGVTPNAILISGTVPIEVDDTPVTGHLHGCLLDTSITLHIGFGSPVNGGCAGSSGATNLDPYDLPVSVSIPLVAETLAPRQGFTKIDVSNAVINLDGIDTNHVQVCSDCGGFSQYCSDVTNSGTVKGFIVSPLKNAITGQIKPLLQSQLCTKPNPMATPTCPTDTQPNSDNSACVFKSNPNQCVSTLLGLESHIDLSSALASISPGSQGALDILLASGGAMKPYPNKPADNMPYTGHTPNGITLGLLGGALPQPQSSCVPKAIIDLPKDIPTPMLLEGDTIPNWPAGTPGPHADVAIAGRFLNYALGNVYNSGLLCLGVTTDQVAQLQSGLISVLIPSIKKLTFEQKAAGVAITTRPQAPPTLKLGNGTDIKKDPLITITVPKFAIDFYVWSDDRYVRALTYEADVTVPVNLQTGKDPKTNPNGGILPVLGAITASNGSVTNSELLTDDPKVVADALTSILSGLTGQLVGGGFSPIDISSAVSSLGLGLDIPATGIRKITEGTDDFLTILANLQPATMAFKFPKTGLGITHKTVDARALTFAGYDRTKLPILDVAFTSTFDDGAVHDVEYSWSIDQGTRSAWSPESQPKIQDDYLFFQGKHVLHGWSRIKDIAASQDPNPVDVPFTIDTIAPEISVTHTTAHAFQVDALDYVSPKSALKMRWRPVAQDGKNADYTDWAPLDSAATYELLNGPQVEVQVVDEEGNIGTVTEDLIRGRQDSTLTAAAAGCGCSTPGSTSNEKGPNAGLIAALAMLGGLVMIALRRRGGKNGKDANGKRANTAWALAGLGTIAAVASSTQGCACGDSSGGDTTTGCGSDCNQDCGPALPLGLAGAYLSVAKAKDGSYWVSGYNDAVLTSGQSSLYGDLIVGKYDQGKQAVQWQSVDGLPPARTDGTCPDNDPNGWRHGETEAADDVGLWTSIQLGDGDRPMVSYYDATHSGLKFAIFDNNAWTTYTVKQAASADNGRYSKLLIVDGKPVIAFLGMEAGTGGKLKSRVQIARSSDPAPKDPSAWSFEDALVDDNEPCTSFTCDSSNVCVKSSGACAPTVAGCSPACGSGTACVTTNKMPTCENVIDKSAIQTYPNAFGDYVSFQNGPNGLGVVVYDRIHGNLVALDNTGGGWKQVILDGETGSRANMTAKDTGDTGIGASLFITADGTWHVSYVDGVDETVRYVEYKGGMAGKPEIVDDGSGADGKTNSDGRHIVGDDSFVTVDGSGTVSVFYQDATSGTLRHAVGTAGSGAHKWAVHELAQPAPRFGGFFPYPIDSQVANYWRGIDTGSGDTYGDVAFLTP